MTKEQKQFRFLSHKTGKATKKRVFLALLDYTITQRDKKQLKAVSRYFFINKVLKKTINALRIFAMESKFKGFYG